MNRIVIKDPDKCENDRIVISDISIVDHINNILKLRKGDLIKLCLLNKGLASGEIESINLQEVEIKITERHEGLSSEIHLQIGLCRPPSMKKILEHGTSLGVTHFEFFKTELTEKSYLDSKVFEKTSLLTELGLAQSGYYYQTPKVEKSLEFKSSESSQKYFLSFNSDRYLNDYNLDLNSKICFAIGPERGWTNNEEQMLIDAGYLPLSISKSILRVEIATFALLGQYHLLKK